jgi:hypothetical protein
MRVSNLVILNQKPLFLLLNPILPFMIMLQAGSLLRRQLQQSFNTLTSLYSLSHSLHYSLHYTCISNINNTPATKKRQAITGVRQKASSAHSSITTTLMD